MCKFASFVLTKDSVLWIPPDVELTDEPRRESHEQIISHFNLHPDGVRGPNVLRVEIVPGPKITSFDDYDGWIYRVDQDIRPEWFDALHDEKRARKALLERAEEGFKTVDARGCTALTSLDAKAAKTVDARGCTALSSLDAKAAEIVDASGCTALTSLDAKAAKAVYARGCTALTSLDAKAAEYVDARGCTALTSLDAKAAKTVYASGCTALTSRKTRR